MNHSESTSEDDTTARPNLSSSPAGFVFAILGGLSFGAMGFFVHISSGHAPSGELVFLRALFTLLMLSALIYNQVPRTLSRRARFLWLRGFAGSLSMLAFYWTLQHTSVGRSAALAHMAPVFVILLSWRFLREKITVKEAIAIGLAVTGVVALFAGDRSSWSPGVAAVGLLGAITASVAYVSLRRATADFSPLVVVWSFSLMMMLMALLVPGQSWKVPAADSVLPILGVCVSGMLGQMFLTWSYVYLKAPIASSLGLSSLVFGVLFESLFYRRVPGRGETISYLLILSGVSLLQMMNRGIGSPAPDASLVDTSAE